jgi:hypothetical protein
VNAPDADAEHLRLLSIFHWILAGVVGVVALVPCFYALFGMVLLGTGASQRSTDAAPAVFVGGCFVAIGLLGGLMLAVLSGLLATTGKFIAERRRYTFCQVTACVECLFQPLGTVLGIFTLVVLTRESVRAAFGQPSGSSAPPPA